MGTVANTLTLLEFIMPSVWRERHREPRAVLTVLFKPEFATVIDELRKARKWTGEGEIPEDPQVYEIEMMQIRAGDTKVVYTVSAREVRENRSLTLTIALDRGSQCALEALCEIGVAEPTNDQHEVTI